VTSKRNGTKSTLVVSYQILSSAAAESYDAAVSIPSTAVAGEDGDSYLPTSASAWMTRLATVVYSRQPAAIHVLCLAIMRSIGPITFRYPTFSGMLHLWY
jgi:hypothetical protein